MAMTLVEATKYSNDVLQRGGSNEQDLMKE